MSIRLRGFSSIVSFRRCNNHLLAVFTRFCAANVAHESYTINKEIVDSRLRPQCATYDEYLLVFVVEQNLAGIMLDVFYRRYASGGVARHRAIV